MAFAKSLNDSTSVCSLSPFNTFYIVQALANLGHLEHAVAAVRRKGHESIVPFLREFIGLDVVDVESTFGEAPAATAAF